jgi:glucose 1-dehydrogenase
MAERGRRLAGKFALVTGAARGIGAAVAVRFAEEGATVALNDVAAGAEAEATLARVRAATRAAGGPDDGHRFLAADVSDAAAVEAMFARLLADWPRLDILVNNAGTQGPGAAHELALADYRRILDVNLTSALLCAQAAIRHFLTRPGGGVIVNCTSVHETIPKPGFVSYAVAKGGLGSLTRTLALEYAGRGIRVNAVGPGATLTAMNRAWAGDPERRRAVEAHIPMGRAATPEEIAAVFAFLACDDAAYVTGQTIYACGGVTLFADFRENWAS